MQPFLCVRGGVVLSFFSVLGVALLVSTTSFAAAGHGRPALLVVGSATLNPSDTAIRNRLATTLGYAVTVKPAAAVTTADAAGKQVVFLSATVTSADVTTKFRDVPVPVIVSEAGLLDDMRMTSSSGKGWGASDLQLMILDPSHPLAAGLSGTVTVTLTAHPQAWGRPSAGADPVAHLPTDRTKRAIFGYEIGEAMAGLTAPARRVGFFLSDHSAAQLTAAGWRLFDAAVRWADDSPPYPRSTAITGLTWAATSTIVRHAPGSGDWHLTWADDDNQYTVYGDGWCFAPRLPVKLSLGFARVSGPATDFTGSNIRSPTGEQLGGGKKGKKASGLLMVNGTLYLWVRNVRADGTQSTLAWSTDRARSWAWSTWTFAEFGYPTFLNYGKNYQGGGSYVYVYTPDSPSAYVPADRFVLLRVPKGQITNKSAYRFFRGLDADGDPVWTADLTKRQAVFTHPGRCLRSGITYNAPLRRYLWWQQVPRATGEAVDTRFSGGFGIYDAPTPWGPWTTVYFTEEWDVGPGEVASFPTKWMSSTGKRLYLVFSGDDAFSVRRATLTTP